MNYLEQEGNLFELDKNEYVFAHCIAADLCWGGGISVHMFGEFGLSDKMRRTHFEKGFEVGSILAVETSAVSWGMSTPDVVHKQVLVNLFTKARTYEKPTYANMQKCLNALRNYMIANGHKKLAIPMIGCGLDRLEWDTVSAMIQNTFAGTDIDILVRYIGRSKNERDDDGNRFYSKEIER